MQQFAVTINTKLPQIAADDRLLLVGLLTRPR